MGEDSCRNGLDKKPNAESPTHINYHFQMSVMSSCSEADSESTCVGDVTPDEDKEQELEYGPGIVNKLRTRFLSITLKQSRGNLSKMRRSCSLENILEQKTPLQDKVFVSQNRFGVNSGEKKALPPWSNLKRAKSMDTLLLSVEEQTDPVEEVKDIIQDNNFESKLQREPKVIKRKDGPLNRSTLTICDEELPKPDTVKIYKRMFEPAESKRGSSNARRRPPVLRASAKSGSSATTKTSAPSPVKLNGVSPISIQAPLPKVSPIVTKSKPSAKQPISVPEQVSNRLKPEPKPDEDQVKKEVLNLNRKNVKKEVHFAGTNDIICNGTAKEEIHNGKPKDEPNQKRNVRPPKYLEGMKPKPKVPPHKPVLQKNNKLVIQNANQKPTERKIAPILKEIIKSETDFIKSNDKILTKRSPQILPNCVKKESKLIEVKAVEQNGTCKDHLNEEPSSIQQTNTVNNSTKTNLHSKPMQNGFTNPDSEVEVLQSKDVKSTPNDSFESTVMKAPKKVQTPGAASGGGTSMVFDFRGKDVVSHLAVLPVPFGYKVVHPRKRSLLIDGKESVPYTNGFVNGSEEGEDEDFVDFSTPPPSGVTFEGENVRVGKGSILSTRNKDLKIHFDEAVEKNTFVYPSESSLLEDLETPASSPEPVLATTESANLANGAAPAKLRANTAIGSSGGLTTYTPSVLRTVDNFHPGMFRPSPSPPSEEKRKKKETTNGREEEENEQERGDGEEEPEEEEMLKPADPEFISSWSLSASTSDLLF